MASKSKATLRDYYVLSKPGIVYANSLTAIAGYIFASRWHVVIGEGAGLIVGLALVIVGACASNNYMDRGIDAVMVRTKKRGLVTGVLSGRQVLGYAAIATIAGLLLLLWTQNIPTVILAVIAWIDYVFLYGWSKRTSVHGTLIGCISGAIPLVAGYVAVTNSVTLTAWLLFITMTCWQMAHFYGIALYRLKDYAAAHIPVMPAVYGTRITKWQTLGYMVGFIASVVALWLHDDLGSVCGVLLVLLGVVWLVRAGRSWSLASEVWGKKVFLFSLVLIMALSALLMLNPLLV